MRLRQIFINGYKAGYKKALKEAAQMNYTGNTGGDNSFSTSGSLYDDDDFISPTVPPDPSVITPEDKKAVYKEIRYGVLAALIEYFGDEVHQNLLKPYFQYKWRYSSNKLVEELRLVLRKNKDVKDKYKSKIDVQEVLSLCEEVYDTGVEYALQHADKLNIDNAEAKISECADELYEKVCKSIATSLSKRLSLDTMETLMNGTAAWRYLGKVADLGPDKAGKPDYPYPEDY